MRKGLIGFLFLTAFFYQCSFNGLFMHPYELTVTGFDTSVVKYMTYDTVRINSADTIAKNVFGTDGIHPKFNIQIDSFKNSKNQWLYGLKVLAPRNKFNQLNILFLHGNAGSFLNHLSIVRPLAEKGCNVYIFDYSGFGMSEGKAQRKQLPDDANCALNHFLKTTEFANGKKVIYGQSLGGHLTLEVAKQHQSKLDAVVIEGSFTNHDEIGAASFKPGFIAKILIREFYNGKENIRHIRKPILVIHSKNDETIPFYMGQKLFSLANAPRQFYELEKCHVCGPIHYTDSIIAKIKRMVE